MAIEPPLGNSTTVSALRVVSELERVGDLALRVIKLAPKQPLVSANDRVFEVVNTLADRAIERYRSALNAWATMDVDVATALVAGPHVLDIYYESLMEELPHVSGGDAVDLAFNAER